MLGVHARDGRQDHGRIVIQMSGEVVQFDLGPPLLPFALLRFTEDGLPAGPNPMLFLPDQCALRVEGAGRGLRSACIGFKKARFGVPFSAL